jgi:hypothetical protein
MREGASASLTGASAETVALELVQRPELMHVDAHEATVAADPRCVWRALGEVLSHERLPGRSRVARLLGAEPTSRCGDPLVAGSTLPGFRITRADAPRELALEGQHRFAVYALTIRVREHRDGTLVSVESRARFIGFGGRVYRALVIRARTHALVVRSMLGRIRAQAESAGPDRFAAPRARGERG